MGALVLMLFVSYHLSFKKTIQAKGEYKELSEKSLKIANLDNDLRIWNEKNKNLDDKFGGSGEYDEFQENLLHTVGEFCNTHRVILSEFSEPFTGVDGGYEVESISLKIKGIYHPLLRLVNHLEKSFSGGKIASTKFLREKNFKSNKEELFLTLYVQKINKKENESE